LAVPKPRTGILMFGLRRSARLKMGYSAAERLMRTAKVMPDGLSLGRALRVQPGRLRMLGAVESYYRRAR